MLVELHVRLLNRELEALPRVRQPGLWVNGVGADARENIITPRLLDPRAMLCSQLQVAFKQKNFCDSKRVARAEDRLKLRIHSMDAFFYVGCS